MPLTVQQNGSTLGGQPNTAMASWWNDYHDLLTGVMLDQGVILKGGFNIHGTVANPAAAPSLTLATGTTLGIGGYQYAVAFGTPGITSGLTGIGPTASITTTSGNQAVNLSNIPTGPAPTSQRNLYRTKVGGSTFFLLATLADNTTTTYADTTADASLGTQQPPFSNNTGALLITDSSGVWHGQIYPGGAIAFDTGLFWSDGAGNVHSTSLNVGQPVTGNATASILYMVPSGTPTVSTAWQFLYDGSSGDLYLSDQTHGRTVLRMHSSNGALELGTNRNGSLATVEIYTGTNTPSGNGTTSPATGAIWIKA